ncbi:MAG: GNAT family N-acetyltransferase [Rhodobacteraceae bacterium]|nr:GNAT family N-acetyltransferase [Paracoccaceae bacterium]
MTLTVRALAPSDRSAWTGLWRDYLRGAGTTLSDAHYTVHFNRLTDPADTRFSGFVATDADGGLVGLAHCIWHGDGWTDAEVCCLQDLFTAENQRGHGVAHALIAAVYDDADARGAADVYWMTRTTNAAARRLYDQVGRQTPYIKYERAG